MKITKAYIVYGQDGDEIALLKARSMAQAEKLVADRFGPEAVFNHFISETEVNAEVETFGWKR